MEKIKVDNVSYDPYFMLNVCPEDTESQVTKSFRKLAKIWHPDKLKFNDNENLMKKEQYKQMFKVIYASYEYIMTKKNSNYKKKDDITINKNDNLPIKQIYNSNELNHFNKEFEKNRVETPNDFGYTVNRFQTINEYEKSSDSLKPYKLFDSKKFNQDDFNSTFEYNQKQFYDSENKHELQPYHKTSDGFNAFNSCDLNGAANVSSYNGVMIVGDTFGQSGVGYYDNNFSDYKQTFSTPKNPNNKIKIPKDFKINNEDTVLTQQEFEIKLQSQIKNRKLEPIVSSNYKHEEQTFLGHQKNIIKEKIKNDKKVILQYQNMFDKEIISNAFNGNLICSSDYTHDNTNDNTHDNTHDNINNKTNR
jgi:curved DNA-binding protein CbpA